jgi:hypothetical protein
VVGAENLAEIPADPILIGLAHKLDRKIIAKSTVHGNIF